MQLLVKGLRVKPDNKLYAKRHSNSHSDEDHEPMDFGDTVPVDDALQCGGYPLTKQLDEIDSMLQSRTKSVIQFLSHLANAASSNDSALDVTAHIESIERRMSEHWKATKELRSECASQRLLHRQQVLLEENWDLSLRYKSLFRNYKFVTSHPKHVVADSLPPPTVSPQPQVATLTTSIPTVNGGPAVSSSSETLRNGSHGKMESDDSGPTANGLTSVTNGVDESAVRDASKSVSLAAAAVVVDAEEMCAIKKEVEYLKAKCEKQRQEMHDLENELSESNKMVSGLKAKNDNFMRQVCADRGSSLAIRYILLSH